MYIAGITTVLSGSFNSDSLAYVQANQASWHGTLHDLSGSIGTACAIVATFFFRGVFARDAQWRRFAPHALMFAITMVSTFVLVLVAPTDSFGVAQRLFVTVDVLWMGTLGCGLLGAKAALPHHS
jgi:hypothetical protein